MSESDGYLTTHILDTVRGLPADGVTVELYSVNGGERVRLGETVTNADGRTDSPILAPGEMTPGVYELVFHIGDYFARQGISGDPPFLDLVPVRFGIDDPERHYHVPLLAAPYSYGTYRGS